MDIVELATKLVSFDTVSPLSSTCDMAGFISDYLSRLGFEIEQYPYSKKGVDKMNLIARINGKHSRVALSGHMDTVGYTGDWEPKSSALKLVKIKDGFYGRGIADMKLFLAIALKVAETISERSLEIPLALCFTSDEEIGCVGAKRIQDVHIADAIIIGEPTELVPVYCHKGYLYIAIELEGESGHSSNPANGISVIPALVEVLSRLLNLETRFRTVIDENFSPPFPTMNIGVISTDGKALSQKNKIPGFCRIEVEVRPVPGQSGEEIFLVIQKSIGEKIGKVKVKVIRKRLPAPPLATPIDSKLVQVVSALSKQEPQAVCFNTEGGIFSKPGVDVVIWGPGSIKQAHSKNEFVDAKYFSTDLVDLYVKALCQLCEKGESHG